MLKKNVFIRRNWRSIFASVTYVTDSLAIFSCGITVRHLPSILYSGSTISHEANFLVVTSFWVIWSFFSLTMGLYRQSYPANSRSQFLLAAKSYVYAITLTLISFYFLQVISIPRSYILLFLLLVPTYFLIGRGLLVLINHVFQRLGLGIYNTLVMVNGAERGDILSQFRHFPGLGYNVKGLVVNPNDGQSRNSIFLGQEIPVYTLPELDSIITQENIDRVFIPSTSFVVNGFHEIIEGCKLHRIKLKVVSPEANSLLRMARIYDIAGIALYSPPRPRIDLAKRVLKRIFDLVCSAALIVLLSPIFILTGIAIYLESGWPVVYTQRRASIKGGKEFQFIKFRSMIQGAEIMRKYLSDLNESSGALFKMKNDPRMTRVGYLIRKFSIDELPQLFNVFIGDMSLVGPRPLPVEDLNEFITEDDFWAAISDRSKVKPGITGLWQISGRSNISFNEMVLLDLYYVEHQSLLFDLEILFETIPTVLFSRGAY